MRLKLDLLKIIGFTHFCITPANCATHTNDTPRCCYLCPCGRITAPLSHPLKGPRGKGKGERDEIKEEAEERERYQGPVRYPRAARKRERREIEGDLSVE